MKPTSSRARLFIWPCAAALALAAFAACLSVAEKSAREASSDSCASCRAVEAGPSTPAFAGVEGEGAWAHRQAGASGAVLVAPSCDRKQACWSLVLQKTRLDV